MIIEKEKEREREKEGQGKGKRERLKQIFRGNVLPSVCRGV